MQLIPPVQQMDRQNHHRLWVYCAVCTLYMSYCTSYCVLCNTYSIVFHVLYFVQYILYCEVAIKTPTDRPVFPTTTSQQPIHLCFHRHCHCHQNHVQCFFSSVFVNCCFLFALTFVFAFPTTTSQQPFQLCFHHHCRQNHVFAQCFLHLYFFLAFYLYFLSVVFICVNICILISHSVPYYCHFSVLFVEKKDANDKPPLIR